MSNLRQRAIADLKRLNIKDWSLPVVLISPDGVIYDTDNETEEELKAVQILYDRKSINPENGEEMVVKEPIITLAVSSLARVPVAGEKWGVRFPLNPLDTATLTTFTFTSDHAVEDGASLGFIKIFPQKAEQS